jgi:hypothetical protein
MAQKRVQVREYIWLDRFMPPAQPILVECEKCGQCATLRRFVFPSPPAKKLTRGKVCRLGDCSCLHGGHQWSVPADAAFFTAGPLWLKTPCHNHVLWILNRQHLDFLEQFVQAELREERLPSSSSRRMSAALPRWMLAGKNRDDVVRCLRKLREKLDRSSLS